MPKFTVGFTQTAQTYVEVEADTYQEAINKASMETPGTICHKCSSTHEMSGDWEPTLVQNADGEEVWSETYGEA